MRRSSAPDRHPPHPVRLGGALPLQWKLPLLVTAFLAGGVALMLAFTYVTLHDRAEAIVRDRLTHAVREVAGTAEAAMARRAGTMRGVADDEAVLRVLRARAEGGAVAEADAAAAREALARLASPRDTALPVELWDARGRVVVSVGRALPAAERRLAATDGAAGAVRFGTMYAAQGRVRFWITAPVSDGAGRLGWVAQPRNVAGPQGAMEMLRAFLREEVTLYTRNADGSLWSVAPGAAAEAPRGRDSTARGPWHLRPAGRMVAAEAPVAGTPWVMVMESPERWIAQRPRTTVRQLALVGALLVAAGAALAWAVGRRVARPLQALTAAAEAVAAGRYERPVAGAGRDEIARLAASFDAMARQVEGGRRELEGRVADAQRANERLLAAMVEAEQSRAEAEQARAEAELANRAKGDFLAVMSHELRTPLNAIAGYTQLLEMGIHGPVTEAQREALARIGRSQEHLLALINEVLEFARLDAGQVQYTIGEVPLRETLAEVEAIVAPQVRSAGLVFVHRPCGAEVAARGDRDRVRQVVLNLLGNAVKYTPPGGTVSVECEADELLVRVHVRDTGTGIRPDRLPFIFEPFVQGERALNRPDEGVGLGLAISRDLARGMGGELRAASEVGKGSTFTLLLPRAGAPVAAMPGVPVVGPGGASVGVVR